MSAGVEIRMRGESLLCSVEEDGAEMSWGLMIDWLEFLLIRSCLTFFKLF